MSNQVDKPRNINLNPGQQRLENGQGQTFYEQIPPQQQQQPHRKLNLLYPEFQEQYSSSLVSLNPLTQQARQKIQKWTWNREKQNYLYFIEPEKFVEFSKKQRLQHFQQHNSQLVTHYLLEAMRKRQDKIETMILEDNFVISSGKQLKKASLKQNQTQPQNNHSSILTPQEQKAYQQQLQKRHQQILLQHKKQRQRIQKLKQQQLQQKKHQQLTKQTQQQKQKQEMKRHHSELISKKMAQQKERKQKLTKEHEQRKKDYEFVVKSWASSVLLHEKMEREWKNRYEKMFDEERKRIQSQKQKFSLNAKIEDLNIKQHEEKYLSKRSQRQAVRAAKLQQKQRMVETYEKQLKKYKNYRRPYDQNNLDQDQNHKNSQDDQQHSQIQSRYNTMHKKDKTYHEIQQQKRAKAMERRKKMEEYWETFVKQEKQPKIDPKKQQEIQNIIESLEKARKMRKVKNEKGEYEYQELKLCDPTLKGMEYLQHSRQIGRLRKSMKRKDPSDDKSSVHQPNQQKKRSIDYLKQLRQSRSSSLNSSSHFAKQNKLSFLDKNELSFHEKLQRVDRETFKLEQLTKNSENQLKYGKFKTSQEILQYKEDIDNNHVEILKMKIRLAAGGNGRGK